MFWMFLAMFFCRIYIGDFDYPKRTSIRALPWGRNPALQVDFPHLGSFGVMDDYASLAWLREMKVLWISIPQGFFLLKFHQLQAVWEGHCFECPREIVVFYDLCQPPDKLHVVDVREIFQKICLELGLVNYYYSLHQFTQLGIFDPSNDLAI